MEEELIYPELPEGYVWKKRGEVKRTSFSPDVEDVEIHVENALNLSAALVAWVSTDSTKNGDVIRARNRETIPRGDHGKVTEVSSYQEGINLIHAQLCLGLIGKGKCLQE
jgi:hypothetical protein